MSLGVVVVELAAEHGVELHVVDEWEGRYVHFSEEVPRVVAEVRRSDVVAAVHTELAVACASAATNVVGAAEVVVAAIRAWVGAEAEGPGCCIVVAEDLDFDTVVEDHDC